MKIGKTKKQTPISLLDILPKKLILPKLYARTKRGILRKISDLFYKKKIVHNKNKFYKHLIEYENWGTTGLGKGVAFPYAMSDTDYDIIASILINRKGIDFDSLDEKPTHIFIAITGKFAYDDNHLYLRYLARIIRLIKNKAFRKELVKAEDVNSISTVIKTYEEKLI